MICFIWNLWISNQFCICIQKCSYFHVIKRLPLMQRQNNKGFNRRVHKNFSFLINFFCSQRIQWKKKFHKENEKFFLNNRNFLTLQPMLMYMHKNNKEPLTERAGRHNKKWVLWKYAENETFITYNEIQLMRKNIKLS